MRVFLAWLLVGCAGTHPSAADRRAYTEHRVPESECRAPGPERLGRAAMARDLAVLERLFQRGYAGRDLAASPAVWNAKAEDALAALPVELSLEGFRDYLAEHYRWLDDNHVGFWYFDPDRRWRSTGGHERPYAGPMLRREGEAFVDPEGVRLARCETLELAPFRSSESIVERPLRMSREPAEPLRCETVEGEERSYGLTELEAFRDPGGAVFEREGGRVVLRSLMTTNADPLEAFVAAAEPLRHEPVVMLDMRFTGGGADRYLVRFFAHFTSQQLRYWTTGALVSETTLQGARNFWGCIRANAPTSGEAGNAWLDQRIARADRDLEEGIARGPFYDYRRQRKHVPPKVDEAFDGRLIVVTGPRCASACETVVLLAQQIPGSWIVGQNTSGTMKVGELRWYRLPESRIWVALGRRAHIDPTGRFAEGRGFLPDVWIDGAEAEARLDALYACAADPECAARVDAAIDGPAG